MLGVDRGRYTVLVDEDGPDERRVLATRARELRKQPIVNGDRARVVGDLSGDEGTLGRIVGIEERTSLLRRSADDTDQVERVIVANADQMLIVVAAADPEPRERLVDRYLVAALDAGIRPLLVVTKTDLADPSEFLSHFAGLDLRVFTSAQGDMPLDEIGEAIAGHATVFVGHSGVGKSTLVNALTGSERATGHVNTVTGRGRHTSSSAVSLRYRGPAGRDGSSTHPASAPSGWATSTRRTCWVPSPTSRRSPRSAPAGAPTCPTPRLRDRGGGRIRAPGSGAAARLDSLQRLLTTFQGIERSRLDG